VVDDVAVDEEDNEEESKFTVGSDEGEEEGCTIDPKAGGEDEEEENAGEGKSEEEDDVEVDDDDGVVRGT